MSEQEKKTEVETVETTAMVLSDDTMQKFKALAETDAKSMQKKMASLSPILELTADYLEMEKGEIKRCLYLAKTTIRQESGNLPAVKLITDDKKTVITASTIIVNTLSDLPEFTAVEIIFKGEKKLTKGKTLKEYSINLLDINE